MVVILIAPICCKGATQGSWWREGSGSRQSRFDPWACNHLAVGPQGNHRTSLYLGFLSYEMVVAPMAVTKLKKWIHAHIKNFKWYLAHTQKHFSLICPTNLSAIFAFILEMRKQRYSNVSDLHRNIQLGSDRAQIPGQAIWAHRPHARFPTCLGEKRQDGNCSLSY